MNLLLSDVATVISYRPIPGYPHYEAGSNGAIRTYYVWHSKTRRVAATPRVVRPHFNKRLGYYMVPVIRGDGKYTNQYVHVLVALAFHGLPPKGQEVRHDNGVKTNNRSDNLIYGTRLDNNRDKLRHGKQPRGSRHHWAKLSHRQLMSIFQMRGRGRLQQEIADRLGVSQGYVSHVLKNGQEYYVV
jgi:hypothetical protein